MKVSFDILEFMIKSKKRPSVYFRVVLKVLLDITGKSLKITPDITKKYVTYTIYSGVNDIEQKRNLGLFKGIF